MKDKLKYMMQKGSFEAYHLTENGCLEILGRKHKIVDNYFVFDGKNYYFSNQFVHFSSDERDHNDLILATTATKLLIPQENEDYLYIARNHMAQKDLLAVVLYYHDGLLYYMIVSGTGSGRVHPVCVPYTKAAASFCFHFAVNAIAAVNPEMADTLYTTLKQKCSEATEALSEQEQ